MRDERRRPGDRDPLNLRELPHPDLGGCRARQVAGGEDESPDACSQEGLALDPPVADSLVVGENDPPLGADNRQPALVGNVIREMVGVQLDEGTRCGQRSHERPGIGTPVGKKTIFGLRRSALVPDRFFDGIRRKSDILGDFLG